MDPPEICTVADLIAAMQRLQDRVHHDREFRRFLEHYPPDNDPRPAFRGNDDDFYLLMTHLIDYKQLKEELARRNPTPKQQAVRSGEAESNEGSSEAKKRKKNEEDNAGSLMPLMGTPSWQEIFEQRKSLPARPGSKPTVFDAAAVEKSNARTMLNYRGGVPQAPQFKPQRNKPSTSTNGMPLMAEANKSPSSSTDSSPSSSPPPPPHRLTQLSKPQKPKPPSAQPKSSVTEQKLEKQIKAMDEQIDIMVKHHQDEIATLKHEKSLLTEMANMRNAKYGVGSPAKSGEAVVQKIIDLEKQNEEKDFKIKNLEERITSMAAATSELDRLRAELASLTVEPALQHKRARISDTTAAEQDEWVTMDTNDL